ncbi:MAG: adenosine-specific kinase [Limnochordaceae bacterium]|nr:adenosine-specific kinase [Limnochordaceae bacterium]
MAAEPTSGESNQKPDSAFRLELVAIQKPEDTNFILGQSHFIKTVEDLYEAIVGVGTSIRFGLAFCEASGARLVRSAGNAPHLVKLAEENAIRIGAGHSFIVFLENAFPINVIPAIRQVPEVVGLFCASANPVQVVIAVSEQGRGILGVIDGQPPVGVEGDMEKQERHSLLRRFGYKL